MSPDSREKTAVVTHEGLYEFSVMPFDLCNAPKVDGGDTAGFWPGASKYVVYLDDILVMGRTFQEHTLAI